jgi:hypothetical protein
MTVLHTGWCTGPKGEGGLDDATGAGGSGGGASMKQSSGAVDLGQCRHGFDLSSHAAGPRIGWTITSSNFSGMKSSTGVSDRQDGPRRKGYCMGNGLQVALAKGWQRQASS